MKKITSLTSTQLGLRILALAAGLSMSACATHTVEVLPEIPPEPPAYTEVPHPAGLDLGDLRALFFLKSAPDVESLKNCDQDYRKLRERTQITAELEQGAREFVKLDPVKYHWCFYSKVLELENQLQSDQYVDERQKHVINGFIFLTPIARSFMVEYRDSRYMRWAVQRYAHLSELVFFRRVELAPQATQELVSVSNPWGNVRPTQAFEQGVLVKYGIVEAPKVDQTAKAVPIENVATLPAAAMPEGGAPAAVAESPPPAPPSAEDVAAALGKDRFSAVEPAPAKPVEQRAPASASAVARPVPKSAVTPDTAPIF